MPRNYVKKTDRGSYGPELLEEAVKLVRSNEIRVSDAVREYKIPRTTLERHLRSAGVVPLLKTGRQQFLRKSKKMFSKKEFFMSLVGAYR